MVPPRVSPTHCQRLYRTQRGGTGCITAAKQKDAPGHVFNYATWGVEPTSISYNRGTLTVRLLVINNDKEHVYMGLCAPVHVGRLVSYYDTFYIVLCTASILIVI